MNQLVSILKGGWNSLCNLFYPPLCMQCRCLLEKKEDLLCPDCIAALPRTKMAMCLGNKVEQKFWDERKFQRGGAFCYYQHDLPFRQLIHQLKYHHRPQLGIFLGEIAAQEWLSTGFFEGIDYLVPVPLHKRRQRKRGYNQAEMICIGLSHITHIPVDTTHLLRVVNNPTQTHKTATERQSNTDHIFTISNPENWKGKHLLLVDDVLTTGATLRACMQAIRPIRNTQYSVFTLGVAVKSSPYNPSLRALATPPLPDPFDDPFEDKNQEQEPHQSQ